MVTSEHVIRYRYKLKNEFKTNNIMRYLFFLIAFLTLQTTTGQDKDVVFKVTNYYVKDSTMNEVVNLENLAINSDIALVFYIHNHMEK